MLLIVKFLMFLLCTEEQKINFILDYFFIHFWSNPNFVFFYIFRQYLFYLLVIHQIINNSYNNISSKQD